jgi:hypothetical protein
MDSGRCLGFQMNYKFGTEEYWQAVRLVFEDFWFGLFWSGLVEKEKRSARSGFYQVLQNCRDWFAKGAPQSPHRSFARGNIDLHQSSKAKSGDSGFVPATHVTDQTLGVVLQPKPGIVPGRLLARSLREWLRMQPILGSAVWGSARAFRNQEVRLRVHIVLP